ncbi:hypothetical protein HHK36_032171 [Tetracentron sinense]|uniref:C3H1-type domain-containing protein n=1 Tax=Tetracentron sinense TaxID=13715 RepID=A0A835CZT1_TETSI|nr:hypothetical protein HHK36_032171 [Tetracentron sinense]
MPENWQVQNNGVPTSSNASADNCEVLAALNLIGLLLRAAMHLLLKLKILKIVEFFYVFAGFSKPSIKCARSDIEALNAVTVVIFHSYALQKPSILFVQAAQHRGELPERVGQPDCRIVGAGTNLEYVFHMNILKLFIIGACLLTCAMQYFLKTGTCRFGSTCKFHHPRNGHDSGQVSLNILGLPMRQVPTSLILVFVSSLNFLVEEKSCPYYMRTGSCKFGIDCKFHHPQPGAFGAVLPVNGPAALGSMGSSAPSSGVPYVGGLPAWSLPRTPYISVPSIQGPQAYMPVVLSPSPGIIPGQQGWNAYKVSS